MSRPFGIACCLLPALLLALFAPTLRWVTALEGNRASAGSVPVPLTPADQELRVPDVGVERPVSIASANGTLRGILHVPRAVDPARPAILMVTPGFNCRTARYRLYVKLARELEARGWVSLRLDPHGIGDSDGALDYATVPELYNAIEDGLFVEGTRAGLSFLEDALGVGSALLVGLCGGATTSVRTGAADARVAGIVASELPFLFTPRGPGQQEQAAPPVARAAADHFLRSYVRKALDPEAWRRFFTFKSDYASLATSLRVAVGKRLWRRRVTGDDGAFRERLGPRANLGLVAAFRGCLERRIPILCLFGATRNSWYFSEIWPAFQAAVPGAEQRVGTKSIQDADPGFSLPEHCREFLETVTAWVEARRAPGAEAPKRSTPTEAPAAPTHRSHPNVSAASTETLVVTSGGKTESR